MSQFATQNWIQEQIKSKLSRYETLVTAWESDSVIYGVLHCNDLFYSFRSFVDEKGRRYISTSMDQTPMMQDAIQNALNMFKKEKEGG